MEMRRSDGLEVTCIGNLYRGPWEKKYWSSSRGKDRYPYPVGYRAVRCYNGHSYNMEVREGARGPMFVVSFGQSVTCSADTATIAWEKAMKKESPRVKKMQLLHTNCNGAELFGFLNPLVQRLFRELISSQDGEARQSDSPVYVNKDVGMHESKQDTSFGGKADTHDTHGKSKAAPTGLSWGSTGSIPVRKSRTSIIKADMQAADIKDSCVDVQCTFKGKKKALASDLEKSMAGIGSRKRLKLVKTMRKTAEAVKICNDEEVPVCAHHHSFDKAHSQCGGFLAVVPDSLDCNCTAMNAGELRDQSRLNNGSSADDGQADGGEESMHRIHRENSHGKVVSQVPNVGLGIAALGSLENNVTVEDKSLDEDEGEHAGDALMSALDTSRKMQLGSSAAQGSGTADTGQIINECRDDLVDDLGDIVPDSFDILSAETPEQRAKERMRPPEHSGGMDTCALDVLWKISGGAERSGTMGTKENLSKADAVDAVGLMVPDSFDALSSQTPEEGSKEWMQSSTGRISASSTVRCNNGIEVPALLDGSTFLSLPIFPPSNGEFEMTEQVNGARKDIIPDTHAKVPNIFDEQSFQHTIEKGDEKMLTSSNPQICYWDSTCCDNSTEIPRQTGAVLSAQNICNPLQDSSQPQESNFMDLKSGRFQLLNAVVPDSYDTECGSMPIRVGIGPVSEKALCSSQNACGATGLTMTNSSEVKQGQCESSNGLNAEETSQSSEGKGESDSLGQELTKSMITLLLPQAVQFLTKKVKKACIPLVSTQVDPSLPDNKEARRVTEASGTFPTDIPATDNTTALPIARNICIQSSSIDINYLACTESAGKEFQFMLNPPQQNLPHDFLHLPDVEKLQHINFKESSKGSIEPCSLHAGETDLERNADIYLKNISEIISIELENAKQKGDEVATIPADISLSANSRESDKARSSGSENLKGALHAQQYHIPNSEVTWHKMENGLNPNNAHDSSMLPTESAVPNCLLETGYEVIQAVERSSPRLSHSENLLASPFSPHRPLDNTVSLTLRPHSIIEKSLHEVDDTEQSPSALRTLETASLCPSLLKFSHLGEVNCELVSEIKRTTAKETTGQMKPENLPSVFEASVGCGSEASAVLHKDLTTLDARNPPVVSITIKDNLLACCPDGLSTDRGLLCSQKDVVEDVCGVNRDSQGHDTKDLSSPERRFNDDTRDLLEEACEHNGLSIVCHQRQTDHFEPKLCLEHPMPVLAMKMNVQDEHILLLVCCGFQRLKSRVLFLYEVAGKEFEPLLIGSIDIEVSDITPEVVEMEWLFEEHGIHLTPDGHELVLLGMFSICEERDAKQKAEKSQNDSKTNGIKVVSYASNTICVHTTLRSDKCMYCLALPEPNLVIGAGEEGFVSGWIMDTNWRTCKECFVLPTSRHEGSQPSHIIQLIAVPNMPCLVIGCDNYGSLAIWNVVKYQLLSTFKLSFSSPNEIHVLNIIENPQSCKDVSCIEDGNNPAATMALCLLFSTLVWNEDPSLDAAKSTCSKTWSLAFLRDGNATGFILNQMNERVSTVKILDNLGVAGTKEGYVYLWDIFSGMIKIRWNELEGVPITCIASNLAPGMFAVAGGNGRVLCYMKS